MRGGEGNGRVQMERGRTGAGSVFMQSKMAAAMCRSWSRCKRCGHCCEEFAEEGEKNERDRRGIDEHEHGNGVFMMALSPMFDTAKENTVKRIAQLR